MEYDYKNKLCGTRMRNSTIKRNYVVDEFYSDRIRIINSSYFRRLQQTTQTFSLVPNTKVRTRLTHSIEVSDLGRILTNKIGNKLLQAGIIQESSIKMMVAVVENACLLHDVGNPPFGHFGETAIQEWGRKKLKQLALKAQVEVNDLFVLLTSDFIEFGGNPQGFRTISKLHSEKDENSLNLTYATLLCGLKYSRAAGDTKEDGILKKPGYFQSEKEQVEKIYAELNMEPNSRFPLSYITEAAYDIAFSLSGISEGIEKGIITPDDFAYEFKKIWKLNYKDSNCPVSLPDKIENFGLDISVKWSQEILDEAAEEYIKNHELYYTGKGKHLIPENGYGEVLRTIKQVSRNLLYKSPEAEKIAVTSNSVIIGLLNYFSRLLELPLEDFSYIVNHNINPSQKKLQIERRILNRINEGYIKSYVHETKKLHTSDTDYIVKEWWLRTHLIVDYINGMTDDFALATYKMINGVGNNNN